MGTVTITFDPDDPRDLAAAQRHLARFTRGASPATPDDELRERVTALIRGYGKGRLSYLRLIAEASPEAAPYRDIEALFDSPKAIGGTHSSIERSWRGMGATTDIIETDMNGSSKMAPDLARLVLEVLDEHESGR